MKRAKLILIGALTLLLAGCVLSGKPKAPPTPTPLRPVIPAPPPEPLSVPQTQVNLPTYQPVNPRALETALPVDPAPPAEQVAVPPVPKSPQSQRTPPVKAPETPPVAPPVVEVQRPPIQEVLRPDESARLLALAKRHRDEVKLILDHHRPLNGNEVSMVANINQFLKQSEQAEENKDMRSANEFAEKAYILAKELQGGK